MLLPTRWLTQKPAGIALCRELGVALSPTKLTRAFVAHCGRLRALPDAGVFGIPTDCKSFARSRAFPRWENFAWQRNISWQPQKREAEKNGMIARLADYGFSAVTTVRSGLTA